MTVGLAAACTPAPAPEGGPDPCAVLSTECPFCAQPGPKQTCQTAVASSDDIQCTVALDDSQVIADCVVPDGGNDVRRSTGRTRRLADLAPVRPVASLARRRMRVRRALRHHVRRGRMRDRLRPAGAVCSPTCDGGGCVVHCLAGATCEASCDGGRCVFDCQDGSSCASSCAGGGCAFQCADGSVCNNTCATTPPCTP